MTAFSDAAKWVASAFDVTGSNGVPPPPPASAGATHAAEPPPVPAVPAGPLGKLRDALDAIAADSLTDADLDAWAAALTAPMQSSGINTPKRIAAFLGQVAVETGGLHALSENLNYSAAALTRVWPSHFTPADAESYAHNPERIANRAYANRMGNGDEASGDGWRFRGGGALQLTGRENHTAFAAAVKMTPEQAADWMRTIPGAAAQACWYWTSRGCNANADLWAISQVTMKVNGGTNGLAERVKASNDALAVFG